MANLYSEILYTFIQREGKEFLTDPDEVKPKPNLTEEIVGKRMNTLVVRFKEEIVPTLTEEYMKVKCQDLQFGW
jgi:hypothetical protein